MCSELFRIPYVWGGVPMFGVGVLLAVWAVASAIGLGLVVRRQGWSPEAWSLVPVVALAGAAIFFLPRVFPDGLPIRGYGVMVLLGAVSGVGLAVYRARQVGLHPDVILSLAFWLFVCGILGARLFYVIEYWEEMFQGRGLWEIVKGVASYTEGGLVVYGALIGAAVAFLVFVRRNNLPTLAMADLVAPSLMIGLAFGRIGCLLNGCCYGSATELPWAVTFPAASPPYQDQVAQGEMYGFGLTTDAEGRPLVSRVEAGLPAAEAGLAAGDVIAAIGGNRVATLHEASMALVDAFIGGRPLVLETAGGRAMTLPAAVPPPRSRPIHPTQIYSAINAGLICWFLWAWWPYRRRDGEVVALLLTIYPITRFLLEILRIDESAVFGTGLSISQNISLVVFVGAMGLWAWLARQPRERVWNGGLEAATS